VGDACFAISGGFKNPTASDLWAWHSPNPGDLGSVLGIAKLLNLDEKMAYRALSIQQWVVGAHTPDLPGTLMMRYQHAFLCQSAVNAVALAQLGVTGPANIFGGPTGYLASFYPWKNDVSLLTKDLGKRWNFAKTSFKAYAGCFFTHSPMTAMEELRKEFAIDARNIAAIEVTLSTGAYNTVAAKKEAWDPQNMAQAQFSLPYTLATMGIYGKVFVDDYTPNALARSDVRELMTKIKAKADEKLPPFATIVKVELKDGTERIKKVQVPKGDPVTNPMTWSDVIQKFKWCFALSAKPMSDMNAEKVIQMVRDLEKCDDVNKVISLLIP
jgi:2-methylcitrate dehydratase PrpD